MRLILIVALVVSLCGTTSGQQALPAAQQAPPAAALSTMASSAEVQALIARMKRERREDQPVLLRPLVQTRGYTVNLELRVAPARAVIHETDSELLYVIDGKGTLTMGGTLVEPQRQNAQNMAGKAIAGGTPHVLGKGDFVLVPNGTTHSFTAIDGELVVISLRLPVASQP